jgi:flavin-binding protein dodecin
MDDHIYKIIELAGSSATSIEDAIQNAISRASQSVHGLRWFEVIETRGHIDNGRVAHYQVVIKVGFTVEDRADA